MALTTLTKEEFQTYSDQVSSRSFMQSVQMGDLLEKRGARIVYLALKQEGEIQVAALVYSLPMLGVWNSIRGRFIPNKMLFQFFMQS
ncbi:peptidoglycan branched peptide synthesis protein%2C femAB family [Streptococcus pneumoniae]|nr:peptidoglycan branched peptide synthesis protein%2C femAB family [Streptococcus pneumoniae]